ncbi:MAG: hypothetical protein WBM14_06860 [Terracidiphilus sp.]
MKQLLKLAISPVAKAEPGHDLWPAVLRRLGTRSAPPSWVDWALLGGLVTFAVFCPASIPVFLYYL